MFSKIKMTFFALLFALPNFALATCLASGTDADIQDRLDNAGANAVVTLCPGSNFNINNTIRFKSVGQHLTTEGRPTGPSRASLILRNSALSTVIAGSLNNIKLSNLIINGNRPQLGYLAPPYGRPAVALGGMDVSGILVADNQIMNPRGGAALVLASGTTDISHQCRNATIVSNQIGPAGFFADGTWADGLILTCRTSRVQGNQIVDVSHRGMVLKDASASIVAGNTITARTRTLRTGIAVVETGGYDGNYMVDQASLSSNQINAESAPIKIGLSIGSISWAASGRYGGNIDVSVPFDPTIGNEVRVGLGSKLTRGHFWGTNKMKLTLQWDGNLVLRQFPSTRVLWADRYGDEFHFQKSDGNIVLYRSWASPWSPQIENRGALWLALQNDGNMVVRNRAMSPLWDTETHF